MPGRVLGDGCLLLFRCITGDRCYQHHDTRDEVEQVAVTVLGPKQAPNDATLAIGEWSSLLTPLLYLPEHRCN